MPATVECNVCLAQTSLSVKVGNKPTLLVVGGKVVSVLCELCAAELGIAQKPKASK